MPASRICYMSTCPFNVSQSTAGCTCWITCNWFTDAPRIYTATSGTSPIYYDVITTGTKIREEVEWQTNISTVTSSQTGQ